MLKPIRDARIDPQETLKVISNLQRMFELQESEFELFHHWGAPRGNLKRFVSYCNEDAKRRFQLDGNNHRLHQRLAYALACCDKGELQRGKSFADLAKQASKEFPPI